MSLFVIAEMTGNNEKYLSSLFKKDKWIFDGAGIVSVKNVAMLSGFGDTLYFSKVFKESEGITPKEYIKKLEAVSANGYN